MKNLLEVIKLSTGFLQDNGVSSPRREAEQLIADCLGVKRIELYMQYDRPLQEQELVRCREYVKRRSQGEPSQYIHGSVEFFDCLIKVSPDVLIPRQETEILVDKIVKVLEADERAEKELWDICCGSGCIGIALKKRFPELKVVLSDVSEVAIDIAQINAKANNVEVEFLTGDLLIPFNGRKAHYVVSNPPYVSEDEYTVLEREVKEFEPRGALVPGNTGLEIYERFAQELPSHLHSYGKVWFEIGDKQGGELKNIFNSEIYRKKSIEKDWSDKDRFFFLEIE